MVGPFEVHQPAQAAARASHLWAGADPHRSGTTVYDQRPLTNPLRLPLVFTGFLGGLGGYHRELNREPSPWEPKGIPLR